MTTNNRQQPDLLEDDLPEDGELTLEELEQIIGGADPFAGLTGDVTVTNFGAVTPASNAFQASPTTPSSILNTPAPLSNDFAATNKFIVEPLLPVEKKTDSGYSSFLGATGTSGNEASMKQPMPLNMTSSFP